MGLFLYQTFDAVDGMQAYVLFCNVKGGRMLIWGDAVAGQDRVARLENCSITVLL